MSRLLSLVTWLPSLALVRVLPEGARQRLPIVICHLAGRACSWDCSHHRLERDGAGYRVLCAQSRAVIGVLDLSTADPDLIAGLTAGEEGCAPLSSVGEPPSVARTRDDPHKN